MWTCKQYAYHYHIRSKRRSRCSSRHSVGVEINGQHYVVLMVVIKRLHYFFYLKNNVFSENNFRRIHRHIPTVDDNHTSRTYMVMDEIT